MRKVILAAALSVPLAACAHGGGINKQTGGAVLGGVGGAVAGAQFGKGKGKLAATALGTLLGAFVGSQVGASLDRADEMYATHAGQTAFETVPSGQTVAWNNPDSGNSGTITPTRTYEPAPGQYCREYQQTVIVGGEEQSSYGTACRMPDGAWKIVN